MDVLLKTAVRQRCDRRDTTERQRSDSGATGEQWWARWIGDDNNNLILLSWFAVLFKFCLLPFFSFAAWNNISNAITWKIFWYQLYTNLRMYPYVQESKKIQALIINKDERKSLARKNGNENPIWSWNDSTTSTKKKTKNNPTKTTLALSKIATQNSNNKVTIDE